MEQKLGFIVVGHRNYPNDIGLLMAKKAVLNLRKKKVNVVFKDEAIVDPLRARELALEMVGEDLDGVIFFMGTWIEAPVAMAAIRELEYLPLAIWGFPMFEREGKLDSTGSFVAFCVLKGALERIGLKCKYLVGAVDDEDTLLQAKSFTQAAFAKKALKRTRVGLIGYASMGMYSGTFDHLLLRSTIGPEVEHLDTYLLIKKAEELTSSQIEEIVEKIKMKGEIDPEIKPEILEKVARLYGGLKDLVKKYSLNAVCVKCQYELSQVYGCTPCVPLSLLADEGTVCACEGDVPTTVTMAILHYLTDQSIYYGDILDVKGKNILLSSCGFAPFSLANPEDKIKIKDIGHPGFTGLISSFTLKRGKITFARLNEGKGSYRMNIGTGEGIETELRQGRFPALRVKIDGSMDKFLETIASQHYAIAYGDIVKSLLDLCQILNIEPILID